MLTPDFVKLSHNGASDAQASVYLFVSSDVNRTLVKVVLQRWNFNIYVNVRKKIIFFLVF